MKVHSVNKGETMWLIAKKYGVSLESLISANPQIPDPNIVDVRMEINIPGGVNMECKPTPMPPYCEGLIYEVKKDDTLYKIAQMFCVSLHKLIECNPQIEDPNQIYPGQKVCICCNVYVVQPGDTLFKIAQKYGIPLQKLINCNPQIEDPNKIYPGQKICIPNNDCNSKPTCDGLIYTVQPGDTLYKIAQMFCVSLHKLIECNPQIEDPNIIYPGQKICIPEEKAVPMPPCHPMPNKSMYCKPSGHNWSHYYKTMVYVVKAGDTLFKIAKMFGIPLQKLISANPQIPDPDKIDVGQKIFIPKDKMDCQKPDTYQYPKKHHYTYPCKQMPYMHMPHMCMYMYHMHMPCMHMYPKPMPYMQMPHMQMPYMHMPKPQMHMPYMHAPYNAPYYAPHFKSYIAPKVVFESSVDFGWGSSSS